MSWPNRRDLKREMGMDDKDWEQAKFLGAILKQLNYVRGIGVDTDHAYYSVVAMSIFRRVFRTTDDHWYDETRKAMWYLVDERRERQQSERYRRRQYEYRKRLRSNLEIRVIYSIIQRGRYIHVYAKLNGEPEEKWLKFDMMRPQNRQSFVDIIPLATRKHPPVPPKYAVVRRAMGLDIKKVRKHNRNGQARRRAQITIGPSPLRNALNQT